MPSPGHVAAVAEFGGSLLKAVFILVLCPPFPGESRETALTPTTCPGPRVCRCKDVLQVGLVDAGLLSAAAAVTWGASCCQQTLGSWLQLLVPVALNKHPALSLCSGCREVTLSQAKCKGAAPRNIINLSLPLCDSCPYFPLGAGICSPASLSESWFLKVTVDIFSAVLPPSCLRVRLLLPPPEPCAEQSPPASQAGAAPAALRGLPVPQSRVKRVPPRSPAGDLGCPPSPRC